MPFLAPKIMNFIKTLLLNCNMMFSGRVSGSLQKSYLFLSLPLGRLLLPPGLQHLLPQGIHVFGQSQPLLADRLTLLGHLVQSPSQLVTYKQASRLLFLMTTEKNKRQ